MSAAVTYLEPSDKPIPCQGQKLRSHIHRLDQNSVKALSGYSVSINTSAQNWHPKNSTTISERIKESTKALKLQHLAIQPKSESDKSDKEITFYLPKEPVIIGRKSLTLGPLRSRQSRYTLLISKPLRYPMIWFYYR